MRPSKSRMRVSPTKTQAFRGRFDVNFRWRVCILPELAAQLRKKRRKPAHSLQRAANQSHGTKCWPRQRLRPGTQVQPVGYNNGIVVAQPTETTSEDTDASRRDKLDDPREVVDAGIRCSARVQPGVDYFVGLALAQHPSIQAARQRVSAEVNRIPQVRALPDPMFNNTFWPIHDQSIQTAAGRVGNQMSLSQAIPWPEKLRTKAAIVNQEVQIAQAEVDRIEREITEVCSAGLLRSLVCDSCHRDHRRDTRIWSTI